MNSSYFDVFYILKSDRFIYLICLSCSMNTTRGLFRLAWEKFKNNKKGQTGKAMVQLLVSVLIAVTMIPLIADAIAGATNLTAGQTTILAIVPTFIVLGLLFLAGKKSGIL